MERITRWSILSVLVFFSLNLLGQEVQFAQFYNDPYQLNPALAGASKYNRAGLHYRDQWPGIKKNYKTYAGFVDKRLANINSGIGLYVLQDVAGDGALTFTSIASSYAHALRINYNQMIRFGVRTTFANRRIDYNKLLFTDQIIRETTGASVEGFNNNSVSYVDISFGAEWKFNKQNIRIGVAADHLNQPNPSFTDPNFKTPIRYSVYALVDQSLPGLSSRENPSYLSYSFMYKSQLAWDQVDLGAILHQGPFEFGLSYRGIPGLKSYQKGYSNNEAIIVYTGFQWLNVHMGYNYDFSISKLGNTQSFGAHEMTLIFAFGGGPKKKKPRSIPCSDIVGSSMVKKMRF